MKRLLSQTKKVGADAEDKFQIHDKGDEEMDEALYNSVPYKRPRVSDENEDEDMIIRTTTKKEE
jgi:hypothetical protein